MENGSTVNSSVPVQVHGVNNVGFLNGVTAITGVGSDVTCALLAGGSVDCWGVLSSSLTPVQVLGAGNVGFLSGVTAIGSVGDVPCALLAGGSVDCWGDSGDGRMGDGNSSASSPVPLRVHGVGNVGILDSVTALSDGGPHSCVLLAGGSVDCWGRNYSGQLGNHATVSSSVPVQVHGVGNHRFLVL